jgi:hypothetical protein
LFFDVEDKLDEAEEARELDFDDLEDEVQEKYIIEAYEQLDADNSVPYEIATGDEGTIYEYEPILDLARSNYEDSFEDD